MFGIKHDHRVIGRTVRSRPAIGGRIPRWSQLLNVNTAATHGLTGEGYGHQTWNRNTTTTSSNARTPGRSLTRKTVFPFVQITIFNIFQFVKAGRNEQTLTLRSHPTTLTFAPNVVMMTSEVLLMKCSSTNHRTWDDILVSVWKHYRILNPVRIS